MENSYAKDQSAGIPGSSLLNTGKSKADQRAERRAIQEAQRAKKASGKSGDGGPPASSHAQPLPTGAMLQETNRTASPMREAPYHQTRAPQQADSSSVRATTATDAKQASRQRSFNSESGSNTAMEIGGAIGKLGIFSHLPVADKSVNLTKMLSFSSPIHPAVLKLGIQYSNGIITGSNSRCVALIYALKQVIMDYVTPLNKVLCRDLESRIKPCINFLTRCRPMSVSMGNAIRHIKWLISHTPVDMSDNEAKNKLIEQLDHFVEEKIVLAGKAIAETYAAEKINNGDVILTYSCSSLVIKVLINAHQKGKQFSVVVVDGRPRMEGRELLRRLVGNGLKCSYVHINAISYIMPEISKIFLGAESLLANGYVMSRVGSSQVALVAKAFNVPVLVCCETYKFCERVQTDSIVHNELGNPEDLCVPGMWKANEDPAMMSRLNLMFDVTPPDMITVVITELGMVPCTSVPVVLRVKHALVK